MSDVKNVDVMLESYSRNDEGTDQSENELNLDSEPRRPQRDSNLTGEAFTSLLTNSRENSEITIETTRMITEETNNQMSRRLNEIKTSLNSHIQDAITAAITNTVLPSIQNTLDMQGRANFTVVDRGSRWLQRNPEAENAQKRDKIVPESALCRKILDKCLVRVQ